MQERHRGRVDAAGDQAGRGVLDVLLVKLLQDRTVGRDPPADLHHVFIERLSSADVEREEIGTLLRADEQKVGEAAGHEQGRRHAAPLEEGVRPEGRRQAQAAHGQRPPRRGERQDARGEDGGFFLRDHFEWLSLKERPRPCRRQFDDRRRGVVADDIARRGARLQGAEAEAAQEVVRQRPIGADSQADGALRTHDRSSQCAAAQDLRPAHAARGVDRHGVGKRAAGVDEDLPAGRSAHALLRPCRVVTKSTPSRPR